MSLIGYPQTTRRRLVFPSIRCSEEHHFDFYRLLGRRFDLAVANGMLSVAGVNVTLRYKRPPRLLLQ